MRNKVSNSCKVWTDEWPFPVKLTILHESEFEYEEFEHEFSCDEALLLAEALENAVEEYRCQHQT